jgi:hypothetical protein
MEHKRFNLTKINRTKDYLTEVIETDYLGYLIPALKTDQLDQNDRTDDCVQNI